MLCLCVSSLPELIPRSHFLHEHLGIPPGSLTSDIRPYIVTPQPLNAVLLYHRCPDDMLVCGRKSNQGCISETLRYWKLKLVKNFVLLFATSLCHLDMSFDLAVVIPTFEIIPMLYLRKCKAYDT